MPRPEEGKAEVLGAGEIFVEFEDIAGASKGRQALAGRSFNGKAVKATFFPHDLFQVRIFYFPHPQRTKMSSWNGLDKNGHIISDKIDGV